VTGGRRAVLTVAAAIVGFVPVAVAVGGKWGSLERSGGFVRACRDSYVRTAVRM